MNWGRTGELCVVVNDAADAADASDAAATATATTTATTSPKPGQIQPQSPSSAAWYRSLLLPSTSTNFKKRSKSPSPTISTSGSDADNDGSSENRGGRDSSGHSSDDSCSLASQDQKDDGFVRGRRAYRMPSISLFKGLVLGGRSNSDTPSHPGSFDTSISPATVSPPPIEKVATSSPFSLFLKSLLPRSTAERDHEQNLEHQRPVSPAGLQASCQSPHRPLSPSQSVVSESSTRRPQTTYMSPLQRPLSTTAMYKYTTFEYQIPLRSSEDGGGNDEGVGRDTSISMGFSQTSFSSIRRRPSLPKLKWPLKYKSPITSPAGSTV